MIVTISFENIRTGAIGSGSIDAERLDQVTGYIETMKKLGHRTVNVTPEDEFLYAQWQKKNVTP